MPVQVLKSVVAWMRYVSLAFPRRLNWNWLMGMPLRVAALAANPALEEDPPWGLDAARAVAGLDVGLLCAKPPGEVELVASRPTGLLTWMYWLLLLVLPLTPVTVSEAVNVPAVR